MCSINREWDWFVCGGRFVSDFTTALTHFKAAEDAKHYKLLL